MDQYQIILASVIAIIRKRVSGDTHSLGGDTSLISDIDIDSLATLEIMEEIRATYGVDLLTEPFSLNDISTPQSIARIILQRGSVLND